MKNTDNTEKEKDTTVYIEFISESGVLDAKAYLDKDFFLSSLDKYTVATISVTVPLSKMGCIK